MRKIYIAMLSLALVSQPVLAAKKSDSLDTPCGTVANACIGAGYKMKKPGDKQFWDNCMKPVLMNKTVKGVKVDAATVKACREKRMDEMKADMADFQSVN